MIFIKLILVNFSFTQKEPQSLYLKAPSVINKDLKQIIGHNTRRFVLLLLRT